MLENGYGTEQKMKGKRKGKDKTDTQKNGTRKGR